jgi:hypothetical protein
MLSILLILPSIGMYVLTSHRITPATINTSKTVNSGIKLILKCFKGNSPDSGKCYINFKKSYIIHTFSDNIRLLKKIFPYF